MTIADDVEQQTAGKRPEPSVQSLLDADTRAVPDLLRAEGLVDFGAQDIDKRRYFSREFHDLEVEKVWKKTWQMACREEDIPEVGDTWVYDVADMSVLVVRSTPDVIKAFPNACLHRGAALRVKPGNVPELRCPFHGFCWKLDGTLHQIPCSWDFPQIEPEKFSLPEYKVAEWEGFVFINMDCDAEPFESYLGDLAQHAEQIARPRLRDRYKAVHVSKVVRCNWKVGLEAFIEAFHTIATHPQCLMWGGDANTQYDVYPGEPHWSRMITPAGVPSPHVKKPPPEHEIAEWFFRDLLGGDSPLAVPEGVKARSVLAEFFRGVAKETMSYDASGDSDCQILDTLEYFLFPNFAPFFGLLQSLTYRFLPYGHDPDMSIMEIMLLIPVPEGQPKPLGARIHELGVDDDLSQAPELGNFGPFLRQDFSNMARVQKGLHATEKQGLPLGLYQESRIRQFHTLLDKYINA